MSSSLNLFDPALSKLKNIYDCFDTGNFRQALKLLAQALQKTPTNLNLLSLKALALSRSGSKEEAMQIVDEQICVFEKKPEQDEFVVKNTALFAEETVVTNTVVCLKENQQWRKYEALLEAAWKHRPSNEEAGVSAFQAFVRSMNFAKQQQIATKMSRDFKKDMYLFWAIASIILQTREDYATPSMPKQILRDLGIKMIEKALADGKFRTSSNGGSELSRFYLSLLEQQNRIEDALKLVQKDPQCAKALEGLPYDRKTILANLLVKAKKFDQANAIFAYLLSNFNQDEWSWWMGLVETTVALEQNSCSSNSVETIVLGTEPQTLPIYSSTDKLIEFIRSIQSKDPHKRGPFLVEIEINHRTKRSQAVRDLLVSYFARFGSKPACFGDLNMYLQPESIESIEQSKELFEKMRQAIPSVESNNKHSAIHAIRFNDTLAKLEMRLANHYANLDSFLASMVKQYFAALEHGKDLAASERQYGDNFLLVCSQALVQQYFKKKRESKSDDWTPLVEAVQLLEFGLAKSVHNFQFKLMLIRLYMLLGAAKPAVELFNTMSIKHIQFETLSYLVIHELVDYSLFDQISAVCAGSVRFHGEHMRESPEVTVLTYQHESYSKIDEFVSFRRRLDQSLHRAFSENEGFIVSLRENASMPKDTLTYLSRVVKSFKDTPLRFEGPGIRCNEDLNVCEYFGSAQGWGPNPDLDAVILDQFIVPSECKRSVEDRTNTVRLRRLVLEIIYEIEKIIPFKQSREQQQQPSGNSQKSQKGKKNNNASQNAQPDAAATPIEDVAGNLEKLVAQFNPLLEKETKSAGFVSSAWKITGKVFEASAIAAKLISTKQEEADSDLKSLESQLSSIAQDLKQSLFVEVSTFLTLVSKSNFSNQVLRCFTRIVADHLFWISIILQVWNQVLPLKKTKKSAASSSSSSDEIDIKAPFLLIKSSVLDIIALVQSTCSKLQGEGTVEAMMISKGSSSSSFMKEMPEGEKEKGEKAAIKKINAGITASISKINNLCETIKIDLRVI